MYELLFIALVIVFIFATVRSLRSLHKGITDIHKKTMRELSPTKRQDTLSGPTGHKTVVKNTFDEKEYIVSTTMVEAPYGTMWQAAVFSRLPAGDVASSAQAPLLIAELGNGYVRVTADLKKVPASKKVPVNKKVHDISDKEFHSAIAAWVEEHKRSGWEKVLSSF